MEYKKELRKFSVDNISTLSLLLFALSFVVSTALNLLVLKRPLLLTDKVYFDIMILVAIYVVGLFVHEGLHALGAILFAGKRREDISFGANFKQMLLYCHVKTPMPNKSYRGLLLLPVIVTGFIPLVISVFFGNIFLTLAFSLLVSGGAGDIIMFRSLLKHDKDTMIIDHPQAPAYYLLYPEGGTPKDFHEVTEEEEKALLEEMKTPPKTSKSNTVRILFILLFLVAAVLVIFLLALFMKLF